MRWRRPEVLIKSWFFFSRLSFYVQFQCPPSLNHDSSNIIFMSLQHDVKISVFFLKFKSWLVSVFLVQSIFLKMSSTALSIVLFDRPDTFFFISCRWVTSVFTVAFPAGYLQLRFFNCSSYFLLFDSSSRSSDWCSTKLFLNSEVCSCIQSTDSSLRQVVFCCIFILMANPERLISNVVIVW